MGRGNVCVTGEYEGLFYIDRDDLDVWFKENEDGICEEKMQRELSYEEMTGGDWKFDQIRSQEEWDEALESLMWKIHQKYPSFRECSRWLTNDRKAVMENKLFYIAVEDNQWSMAVMLIQKTTYYGSVVAMQKRHYQYYLNSIRDILFEQFETLGVYAGAWTSGRISRSDFQKGVDQSA